ncbi:MAG: hypothetical protein ACR2PS_18485 [Pseudomonadales bacterium]
MTKITNLNGEPIDPLIPWYKIRQDFREWLEREKTSAKTAKRFNKYKDKAAPWQHGSKEVFYRKSHCN